jgi:hypothetical protein
VRDIPGLFGTYVRVYLPRNSAVRDPMPAPPPLQGQELGFTTLESYQRVPAQGAASFTYTYQIPTDANPPGQYRLHVFKQPGTSGHAIEIRLHLPPDVEASPSASTGQPFMREGDALVYRGNLETPLDIFVTIAGRQQ